MGKLTNANHKYKLPKQDKALFKATFEEYYACILHYFYSGIRKSLKEYSVVKDLGKEWHIAHIKFNKNREVIDIYIIAKLFLTDFQTEWFLLTAELQQLKKDNLKQKIEQYNRRLTAIHGREFYGATTAQQLKSENEKHTIHAAEINNRYKTLHIYDHKEMKLMTFRFIGTNTEK